jgi:diadenosine tetraphosphatase ApaH/serine/threonine PP2A family protein phosphatase
MPFDRAVGAIRIVNAGSVGLPFGDPAASWALVEPDAITLRRTDYDVDGATARAAATGYPIALDLARPPSAVEMRARFEAVAIGS